MQVRWIQLRNFRNYDSLRLDFSAGTTLITGPNGSGKTSLLEAVGFLVSLTSIGGMPAKTMVGSGAESAIVRGEITKESRNLTMEVELPAQGRIRAQVNKKPAGGRAKLAIEFPLSVFLPDHLNVISGPPEGRRNILDEAVMAQNPKSRSLAEELRQITKQRNSFLRSENLNPDMELLDSLDEQLAAAGEEWVSLRKESLLPLQEQTAAAHEFVSSRPGEVQLQYAPSWQGGSLKEALRAARPADLARKLTTVGPHRDDMDIFVDSLPARWEVSRGNQRILALALRLGVHRFLTESLGSPREEPPLLLLDDVLSELDPFRAERVLKYLPKGQVLITSAVPLAEEIIQPECRLRVFCGKEGFAELKSE